MDEKTYTKIWRRYEKCKEYFNKKSLVARTEENWNFYLGDQWKGCNTGGEKLPVMNFIKPIIKYKVATVSQNSMVAVYSDVNNSVKYQKVYDALNKNFAKNWEKSKMDSVSWEIIRDAAVQGDSYAFWTDGETDKPPQILPNTTILFADENEPYLQKQKFILIRERLDVADVKKIAEENKIPKTEIELIVGDNEATGESGVILNKDEVSEKVTSILCLEKDENGVVTVSRSTPQVVYAPPKPLKGDITEVTTYPIASMIWEAQPFNARGVSEVRQYIPNQLEYNKTLARRALTVKLCAYPRIAYDATTVENPEDLDTVGAPIQVNGGGAQSVSQQVSYLNATNISSDANTLCAELLQNTKDLAGASDYAMGNVNPEQASGQAIIAVRDSAQVTLNETVARYKQFVEDVALLWLDLWIAYNPSGIDVEMEDELGNPQMVRISQEELKALTPSVRIDVSQDNQWTKLSEQQWLDNMFDRQQLSLEEYVELSPDNGTVPKGKANAMLEKRKAIQKQQEQEAQQNIVYDILGKMGMPPEQIQAVVGQYLQEQQMAQQQMNPQMGS